MAATMAAGNINISENLRQLVSDCFAKHLNKSALFFAGKLHALSGGDAFDLYLLAQVCISPDTGLQHYEPSRHWFS
jgi:hypothetical protein